VKFTCGNLRLVEGSGGSGGGRGCDGGGRPARRATAPRAAPDARSDATDDPLGENAALVPAKFRPPVLEPHLDQIPTFAGY